MQAEIEIPSSERYLVCNYSTSEEMIETIKADVKHFMSVREKDECYKLFMEWKRNDNEMMVLTMHAYGDFYLPKSFDRIFEIGNPNNFLNIEILITQAVFNGWAPLNQISRGHKHVVIIKVDNAVPDIFNLLPVFGNKPPGIKMFQLGFCDKKDYEAIKSKLLTKMDNNSATKFP